MSGIDWKRYAQICDDLNAPAMERFTETLRKSAGVATLQSMPAYTGAMKASLATMLRQMTDLLKQMSETGLREEDREKIRWNRIKEQMREAWFGRLCGIENLPIAVDYMNTRIQNRPSDMEGLYRWVNSFQGNEKEIARIARRIREETALFEKEDVPAIMELARLGVRAPKPLRLT